MRREVVSRFSPWRQGRAVLFVSWIPGVSLVIERLLVVLQVGPLLVCFSGSRFVWGGALVSSCSGGGLQVASAAEFLASEFLPFSRESSSANVCRARTVHGAEGSVQRPLVHGACLVSYSRCCAFFSSSSLVRLLLFQKSCTIFVLLGRPRRGRCRIATNGISGATPSTMPRLLRAEVMMLGFCQAGRPARLRVVRRDCHGLRKVYFLGESGTLFVRCDMWHLARFSACHQLPSVGVVLTLAQRPRCLRLRFVALRPSAGFHGASVFALGDCFNCVGDYNVKTVAAWSLVLALALTFVMASTVFIVALMRCRIRKWKNTGIFSHGRTRSSLAVWQEVTTLLQRQERQITPRCVSAGGVPIKTCIVARKRQLTAIASFSRHTV